MSGPLSLRLCCLSAMAPALTEAATQARAKLSSISPTDGVVAGREGLLEQDKQGTTSLLRKVLPGPLQLLNGKGIPADNPLSIIKGMSFTTNNGLAAVTKGGNGKMPQTVGTPAPVKGPLLAKTPTQSEPKTDAPSVAEDPGDPAPDCDHPLEDGLQQEVVDSTDNPDPLPGSSGMTEVGVLTSTDVKAEVGRRQRELDRKADRLLRRLRRLQCRQLVGHTKTQLSGLVDHQHRNLQSMAKSMKSPPTMDMRAELLQSEDVKSLSTAALVSLVQRLQSSQQLSLRQRLTSAGEPGSVLKLDETLCSEMSRTSSTLQMQLRHVKTAVDSDATESSSGGESCDEDEYYDDDKQQRVSIERRAEWHWAMERAAIAARWTWLQAQVSDLEYRIRQQTDIFRQIRAAKGVVVLGEPPSPQELLARSQPCSRQGKRLTPLEEKIAILERKNTEMSPCNLSTLLSNVDRQSTKLTQQLGSVYTPTGSPLRTATTSPRTPDRPNGLVEGESPGESQDWKGGQSNVIQFEPSSPVADTSCVAARCRPVRSYGKRKLLRTAGLHQVSRKAARLSSVKCHCHPPDVLPCVMCGGRYNNTTPMDPDTMPLPERVALLDSSFHPVLSFTQDIPLSVHFEALLKSGDWQHKPPPKLLRPTNIERRRSNKTINDHVRRYNRKLSKSASAAMLSSVKIKNKYDQKPLSWSHSGALPGTPMREKRPYVRHAPYRLKRQREDGGEVHKRGRSMSQGSLTPGGDHLNLSSATLRDMKEREMKRRRGESAFDINNIVIPYSMAALTRVEKLQYKEIVTPKWRELNDEDSQDGKPPPASVPDTEKMNNGPSPGSNGIILSLPAEEEEDENEDISDDQYIIRHEKCEMLERRRFLPTTNKLRRGRSKRTDSQVSLCVMDDGEASMSALQTPPTTPASKMEDQAGVATPATPAGGEDSRGRSGSCSSRDGLTRVASRSQSLCLAGEERHQEMEMIRTYLPWAPRSFPLTDEESERLYCDSQDGAVVEATASGEVSLPTATPEDSRPPSPVASSSSSEIIEDDPNDPEWTVIGDQRVPKQNCPNIILKLAKR